MKQDIMIHCTLLKVRMSNHSKLISEAFQELDMLQGKIKKIVVEILRENQRNLQ